MSVRDLLRGPRGGRVSSLLTVTNFLADSGSTVHVLANVEHQEHTDAGVLWSASPESHYDVVVFNRGIGDGLPDLDIKRRVLWVHDLPHSGFIPEPRMVRALDCIVHMSDYSRWVWTKFYKHAAETKSVRIPNGVDPNLFHPLNAATKSAVCIYASAPNRGLERLPFIWESIDSRRSGFRCKAYSNLKALHPGEHEPSGELEWFKSCKDAGIERLDPIPQHDLAQELRKASLMLLPTDYPEICSNAVLQSLACGTPVITTGGIGATPEWVRHRKSGLLTETKPHDYMAYQVEFVRNAVSVLEDGRLHRKLVRGAASTYIHDWDEIGTKWLRLLKKLH